MNKFAPLRAARAYISLNESSPCHGHRRLELCHRVKLYIHLTPRYIGRAVEDVDSFFNGDGLDAESLSKEVRLKACRYASKNLAKFRLFTGLQHTNRLRFATIDSSANDEWVRFGLSFALADFAAFHAFLFSMDESRGCLSFGFWLHRVYDTRTASTRYNSKYEFHGKSEVASSQDPQQLRGRWR